MKGSPPSTATSRASLPWRESGENAVAHLMQTQEEGGDMPMPANIIVLVADPEDSNRGEITVLDNPRKAEVLVETLLEAGLDQERIRLFSGSRAHVQVSTRPEVALMDEGAPSTAAASAPVEEIVAPEPVAWKAAAGQPAPYIKDGVRFSSLFRPA